MACFIKFVSLELDHMASISEDEIQQLLRTVEMFEAITESQPEDYQSWEILKEAYNKLGRREDSLRASKKLAQAHITLGQISQAILEYEGILEEYPAEPEVVAALADLETKTSQLSNVRQPSGAPLLREDSKPTPLAPTLAAGAAAPLTSFPASLKSENGDQAMADLLIAEKVVTPQAVEPLLKRLAATRSVESENGQSPTLVQLLADEQIAKLDEIVSVLVDRSGLPYLPLANYDVDRDAACLLPREYCFANCVVPFDVISRSALIATINPFDTSMRAQVEGMLPYNVFWYVASPLDIYMALRRAHGLETHKSSGARPR